MDSEIQQKLRERFHPSLVKKNYAGFDHIQGHTAIDRLIQATGETGWSFTINDTKAFLDQNHRVVHVAMLGQLCIGGQCRSDWCEARTGNKADEELFKSAQTDTIKRCARMFGVALELYGDMIDGETGEHTGRQQAPVPIRQSNPAAPVQQGYPSYNQGNGGGADTGRKTYPTVGQLRIAEPKSKAAGLDWTTQADDIIFAALGKPGPLYRNDEFQDVMLWLDRHVGYEGQWAYSAEGHLVAGPPGPALSMAQAEAREDSMDDVPFD
jgi:hypothetical protein